MKINIFLFCLLIGLSLILNLRSVLATEVEWNIERFENLSYATVSGEIQHGDKLAFIIASEDDCNEVTSWFSFYTWRNPKDFKKLIDKEVPIMLNGEIGISATILSINPFLNGNRVILALGTFPIKEYIYLLHKIYEEYKKYEIEIIDGADFQASRYFDITINNWKLDNLIESISKANKICKEIILNKEIS